MAMADFEKAILKILKHEGVQFDDEGNPIAGKTGYVNNPDDPGGETNYGITQRVARANGYYLQMSEIPYDVVRWIYRKMYWDKLQADMITDDAIAIEMFDTAVNCGVETVVTYLQRTLNVMNKKANLYPDIEADGICGTQTIETLEKALSVEPWYRLCILRAIDSLQCVRYIGLAERDNKFETFLPGWLRNRVGIKESV
jgi:lysozyme family protein